MPENRHFSPNHGNIDTMPLVQIAKTHPLDDGRQSDRALAVRRGVKIWLETLGAAFVPEVTLANGRRADIIALCGDGAIWIVEIKSSIADMNADTKWPDYRDFCDRLFFATLPDVPLEILPDDTGTIIADARGAELVRDAPEHKLPAARRKAVLTRFARQAANRLYLAELSIDPSRR